MESQEYYTLGRGVVYISYDGINFEEMGTTQSLNVTVTSDKYEHVNFDNKVKYVDKTTISQCTVTGQLVTNVVSSKNMCIFLLGDEFSQSIQNEEHTVLLNNLLENKYVALLYYNITNLNAYVVNGLIGNCTTENRDKLIITLVTEDLENIGEYSIVATVDNETVTFNVFKNGQEIEDYETLFEIEKAVGANIENNEQFVYNIQVDKNLLNTEQYTVDYRNGLIQFKTNYDKIELTFTTSKYEKITIKAGQNISKGYVFINYYGDPATGVRQILKGYCMLSANGNFDLKGDDWQALTFDLSFNKNEKIDSPLGFVYEEIKES